MRFDDILAEKMGVVSKPFVAPTHMQASDVWIAIHAIPSAPKSEAPKARQPFAAVEPGLARASLNPRARELLGRFERLGARLPERLTTVALRTEWRRLARVLHPDSNPSADGRAFAELRETYAALKSTFGKN